MSKPDIVRKTLFCGTCPLFDRWSFVFCHSKTFYMDNSPVIDSDGFRPNVGIILTNDQGQLLWARRVGGQDAWQFPQGGINPNETPEQALYRELHEEVGLRPEDVQILACTRGWLRYRLPHRLVRHNSLPLCVGQKQKWFLLRMISEDSKVSLNNGGRAEFDDWRWVSYWYPLGKVVSFKRDVYRRALKELSLFHAHFEDRSSRSLANT